MINPLRRSQVEKLNKDGNTDLCRKIDEIITRLNENEMDGRENEIEDWGFTVNYKRGFDAAVKKIKKSLNIEKRETKLQLEPHNFKVNSKGWKKITQDGKKYLENKTKDIWQLADGKCKGEQLFTWKAAMRETKKAGKKIPTDKQFSELLKTKDDMPNVVYPGYRDPDGSFGSLGLYELGWSSSVSGGYAWVRSLDLGYATVFRHTYNQSGGFSVRCLKE